MKKIAFALVGITLIASACSKNSTNPTAPPTAKNPYYFRFTTDGKSYDLDADFPQYMPFENNAIGGYQMGNDKLYEGPSAGIRLNWPFGYTVKENDVTSLKGKTLYFDDTLIQPEISFSENIADIDWYSADTPDKAFYINISDVTYLRNDTGIDDVILRTYVITGTCNAILKRDNSRMPFSNGSFNFIISRRDL